MKTWIEALGTLAAFCTTVCWIPQVLKVLRDKRTEGISLLTQSIFTFGVALWAAYGVFLDDWPLLLANVTTLLLSLAILVSKLRFDRSL
jgi:MtN3 and saliva related transmembrane protein